jgi:hypothetical protein
MESHIKLRELLKQHFPDADVRLLTSNGRKNVLQWEISPTKLYNFEVTRAAAIDVLETQGPFVDCYDLFTKLNIPKWAVEEFRTLTLKFSEK